MSNDNNNDTLWTGPNNRNTINTINKIIETLQANIPLFTSVDPELGKLVGQVPQVVMRRSNNKRKWDEIQPWP